MTGQVKIIIIKPTPPPDRTILTVISRQGILNTLRRMKP